MKTPAILFFLALSLPFTAAAYPIGMQFNGNGCSPPYQYSMDDWIRQQRDYVDSLGPKGPPAQGLTLEESRALQKGLAEQEKEQQEKRRAHAKGLWHVETKATPEGNLCAAVFSKYKLDEGGVVTIMGFQKPKTDAWLIFQAAGLPKPQKVEKLRVTLQQDDEPAQTLQVFNYRESREVGTVMFAVPGLAAALDGMRDQQSFKLSLDGKTLMAIQWTGGAAVIEKLRQCAK